MFQFESYDKHYNNSCQHIPIVLGTNSLVYGIIVLLLHNLAPGVEAEVITFVNLKLM